MDGYHKRHKHHRHPRRQYGEARHRGRHAEQCGPASSFRRRFATRDERIAHLATYLSELRAEAEAVEEHIAELKVTSNS